jgi:hypothetical protein
MTYRHTNLNSLDIWIQEGVSGEDRIRYVLYIYLCGLEGRLFTLYR